MKSYLKSEVKNICCLGAGYVGGPSMAIIAEKCLEIKVTVVDLNEERIRNWNDENVDNLPVYEPGLAEIIADRRNKNLFFSTDMKNAIEMADMIFIAVNTPTKNEGFGAGFASDLTWIESSARQIEQHAKGHTIVIEKSTVPVKTACIIQTILDSKKNAPLNSSKKSFTVLSSPEFLAEGSAINDLRFPDRILIGGEDELGINALKKIYEKWIPEEKILVTNLWSSELSKLVANAFLAQRISSINSITALCEVTGAKINEISQSIGSDQRIGNKFLRPGPGFGGSCFQKDILNLVYLCRYYGLDEVANYWEQITILNNWQRKRISKLIVEKLLNTVNKKKIVILGFSYKPNTNDTRESAAIYICKDLIDNGAKLLIHDPQTTPNQIEKDLGRNESSNIDEENSGCWAYIKDIERATFESDAIVILTEWDAYKNIDWKSLSNLMRKPSWIFDTRSVIKSDQIKNSDINYWGIGKGVDI